VKAAFSLFAILTTITAVQAQTGMFSSNNIKTDTSAPAHIAATPQASKVRFTSSTSRYIGLGYEGGYFLPVDDKREVNDLFRESVYRTLTVTNSWDVPASSVYSRLYRHHKLGLGVSLVNFNNDVLGKPITAFGFTEIPLTNSRSPWYFSYGLGAGIGFGFNRYDKTTNPNNLAIGSSLNAYLEANFFGGYWLSHNFLLAIATGYRHYSNGSTKHPNAGINIIPFQLSLRYRTREFTYDVPAAQIPEFRKNFSYVIYTNVGMKQLDTGEALIFKNLTGFNAGYQFSYKYRVALGFDFTYSGGSCDRVDGDASSFSKHFSYGPYLGWEWFLTERLYIPVYAGVYIHRNYENDETNQFFQRIGVRYLMLKNKQLSAGIGLKTHFGQADFVEFGLGYHIRKR
jgi:opacity protein-like surface antigen